ncbi:hypothetical protein GC175_11760 [bacterium]|nr:hypothetical protein [bacterium]
MSVNPPWPKIDLPSPAWTDAYARGQADLAQRLRHTSDAWTRFAARYVQRAWPIGAPPNHDYANKGISVAQGYWLAWTIFALDGDAEKLETVLAHDLVEDDPFSADPLRMMVALQSQAWMCAALGCPLPRGHADAVAQTQARFSLLPPLDQRLAQLWAAPNDPQDEILLPLLADLQSLAADPHRLPTIIDRCLLLIQLLHHRQEGALAHALAVTAADGCSRDPACHLYLPPLLLDGVLGLVPAAADNLVTWHLPDAFAQIAVTDYHVGKASLLLRAIQDPQAGDHVHVITDALLTLEIVTPERTYVEALTAGEHWVRLTVLDRTDVMRNW